MDYAQLKVADVFIGFGLSIGLFIVAALFLFGVYLRRVHRSYAHIPGPRRTSFFLGNHGEIKTSTRKGTIFAEILLQWVLEYGQTIHFFILHRPFVFTVEPEAVKELLTAKEIQKSEITLDKIGYPSGIRFLGHGLLTEIDEKLLNKRRTGLTQLFHKNAIKDILKCSIPMNEVGNMLTNHLNKSVEKKHQVNMNELIHRATLDVIGKVCFGMELDSLSDRGSMLHDAMTNAIFTCDTGVHSNPMGIVDFFSKLLPWDTSYKRRLRSACKMLQSTAGYCFTMRDAAMSNSKGKTIANDVLTQLIKVKRRNKWLSPLLLFDDFTNVLIAGTYTTANLILFTLMELGRHPNILSKVKDEIDEKIGQKSHLHIDDVNNLQYMECVLKETLRLYPPTSVTYRHTSAGCKIMKYSIPPDATLMMSSYVSSRHPKLVKDASDFAPERFVNGSSLKPQVSTYFPFAMGSRSCLGQHLGMALSMMLLTKIIQKFDMTLSKEQTFDIREHFTLEPNTVQCIFTKKKKVPTATLR